MRVLGLARLARSPYTDRHVAVVLVAGSMYPGWYGGMAYIPWWVGYPIPWWDTSHLRRQGASPKGGREPLLRGREPLFSGRNLSSKVRNLSSPKEKPLFPKEKPLLPRLFP